VDSFFLTRTTGEDQRLEAESEKHKFTELLIQYQDAFSKSATYSVFTDLVQHKINTGTALPIRRHIRRLPFGKREIGNKGGIYYSWCKVNFTGFE
jgi:hypothetical protein